VHDLTRPIGQIRRVRDQVQVAHELADRPVKLVAEHQPEERMAAPLPFFGRCLEANILGEEDATRGTCSLQEVAVSRFRRSIFTNAVITPIPRRRN
jgi:hypothetical protein